MPFKETYGNQEKNLAEAIVDEQLARGASGGGGGGGTGGGDASAFNQRAEITEVTSIKNRLPSAFGVSGGVRVDADFTEVNNRIGATNEATPLAITSASGLNGLLRFFIKIFTFTPSGALKTDSSAVIQPVSGSISVGNFPVTQTVAGSVSVGNFPVTQPVSVADSITVGNFPTTQTVAGSVSVGNFPLTQPISATSLPLPTNAANNPTLVDVGLRIGATTEPAATSATAPSGLVGLLRFLYSLLPAALSLDGRLKTESVTRKLTVAEDKVGATIECSKGNLTDRSGAIVMGGSAQEVMPANVSRKYLLLQNNSTGDLWLNFNVTNAVTNQPSFKLLPNEGFVMESSFVSAERLTVIGATAGQTYTAKEA